ncbi:MAG: lipid-A-disaccharide synthase [Candidatus Omnitrophota bacterium]|nr:lipid-A-disaccharide synthase [Candidatus Omnitrophota bacterium]
MGSCVFILAGESSGDLHGAHLAKELKTLSPRLELTGFGGAEMRAAGVEILEDPTRIAVIGLFEVLRHLSDFKRLFRRAVQILDERRPDLVVLIDYPGFNLRFAREVRKRGIRLVYYISPQIWAWDPGRIRTIKRRVDRMLVLFPFEEALYKKAGVPVTFVGHPLVEQVRPNPRRIEALESLGLADGLPVIGLLPGSREVEVRRLLPVLLAAGEKMKEALPSSARFLLIKAPHLPWEIYQEHLRHSSLNPKVAERWDYDGIHACDLVLVASGTATLECALLERPMVIVYKTSWPTYLLSRLLIRIPHIGLVNVVAGRKVVPELIQREANPSRIAAEALALRNDARRREKMKEDFVEIRRSLGSPGASRRAAEAILAELNKS